MDDGRISEVEGWLRRGGGVQFVAVEPALGCSSRFRWSTARLKASCTVFRRPEDRASVSLILSSVGIPNGDIWDLGSHCQLRLLSKKWTRKSFSADLNCIRSPALRTSRGGWGSSSPLCWCLLLRTLGSMI